MRPYTVIPGEVAVDNCGTELCAHDETPKVITYRGFEGYDGERTRTFANPAELKAHVDQIQQWYDSTNPGAEFTDWTAHTSP
jgi:hypothetical protein